MKQAIAIQTYRGSPWLEQCINSIPSIFPVIVVRDGHYECAALRFLMANTKLDRWLFLHDSTMVKDPSWLYEHWDKDESIGLIHEPGCYGSYMGWWRRSVLERCQIPDAKDKAAAIKAEIDLPTQYATFDPALYSLWPELNIFNAQNEVVFVGTPHERTAKRYENSYFLKWKSSYCVGTGESAQVRDDVIRHLYP